MKLRKMSRIGIHRMELQISEGYIVTDDAPIDLFMKYLSKSVVNYND